MKLYKPQNLMVIAITMIVIALSTMFLSAYTVQKQRERCKRCVELEFAIEQVLDIIREDQTDYYLDVLCETLEQPLDLMPIHEKILEQANITLNHKGKVVEK